MSILMYVGFDEIIVCDKKDKTATEDYFFGEVNGRNIDDFKIVKVKGGSYGFSQVTYYMSADTGSLPNSLPNDKCSVVKTKHK